MAAHSAKRSSQSHVHSSAAQTQLCSYQALLLPPLYLGRIVRTLKGPKSAKVRSPHVVLSFNFAKIDKSVQIYSSRKNIEQTYVQLNEQVMTVISTALVVSFVGLLLADFQVE